MARLTGRDVRFWQKVLIILLVVIVVIIFVFAPIFALPLTTETGETTETIIKRSLFEHFIAENFGIGLVTSTP